MVFLSGIEFIFGRLCYQLKNISYIRFVQMLTNSLQFSPNALLIAHLLRAKTSVLVEKESESVAHLATTLPFFFHYLASRIFEGKGRLSHLVSRLVEGKGGLPHLVTGLVEGKGSLPRLVTGLVGGKGALPRLVIRPFEGKGSFPYLVSRPFEGKGSLPLLVRHPVEGKGSLPRLVRHPSV